MTLFPAPKPRGGRRAKALHKSSPKKVNVARKRREFARAYGSKARVEWVKAQPCAAKSLPPCEGAIHNAHTQNGGRGRKGDYQTIVPLCAKHHRDYDERRGQMANPAVRFMLADAWTLITESGWALHELETRDGLRSAQHDAPSPTTDAAAWRESQGERSVTLEQLPHNSEGTS